MLLLLRKNNTRSASKPSTSRPSPSSSSSSATASSSVTSSSSPPNWDVVKDLIENGCRQYGSVRYDSYFSHWNRIDVLNSNKHDDDYDDENEIDSDCLPSTYDTMNTNNKNKKDNYSRDYNTKIDNKKFDEKEKFMMENNFYKVVSPAHVVEKVLEDYVGNQSTAAALRLQVKIIIEKKENKIRIVKKEMEKTETKSEKDDTKSGTSGDAHKKSGNNDKDNVGDVLTDDPKIENIAEKNILILKDLVQTVSHFDCTAVTARNVKVQENNDERPYSISFLSVPTLNSRTVVLEAVSVALIEKDDIRFEAWKQLRKLQSKYM